MEIKFNLHNYDRSIVGLANSILKSFGCNATGTTILVVDDVLAKNYKNVVVLLLDGLGTSILNEHAGRDGFLRKHYKESIDTVFPPTTVAATTSIISGLQPIEHAWLGWDCYYPQVDKNVTVFLNTEQGTDKPASDENVAWKYCGYKSVVDKINESGLKAYNVTPFVPPFCKSIDEICNQIAKLCETNDKKYIYAYWNQPDTVMHERGCHSKDAKAVIDALEKAIEEMSEKLEDTLLIITADHGHIDGKNVVITDYPAIMECLVRLPSIEPRALNLYVKEGKKEQFEREFRKEFGKDFVLLTKEEVYKEQLFGTGIPHENVDAMIGDYLAIAVTDLTIFNTKEEASEIVGVHAGYTKEEIEIPIIIYESQIKNATVRGFYYEIL